MSLYDDNPLLLARPRPFWEEEEEPIVPPVVVPPPVAPPAAPPPEVEGPGYASLEAIPVAKEAPAPEVVGPGYASLKEIPEEQPPPEVEGPGYASLDEIPGAEPEESFLGKAAKVGRAAAIQLLPNLGQAKAILEPETQKKAVEVAEGWKKDLAEAPTELSDYWKKMQTRYAMGREQAVDDQLAYKAATGEIRWEDVKDRLEPSSQAEKAKGEHWYSEGLLQAVEMVPAMLDSLKEGAQQGLQWGGAAAGATAIAGQVGPQVALPEEFATVPLAAGAGYAGGQAYGTYEYWRRQGTGSLYNDLRKEGIGHEIAKNVSATFGVPYAGIEFLQLTKLVPGMKQAASHAIGEGIKKRLAALGKEKLVEYGEQIGQETSQEVMQATSEALAEWKDGVTPPPEKKGIFERAWNTIVQTSAAMPFLMGPKTVTDVTGAVAGEKAIAAAAAPVPGEVVPPPIPPTPPEAFAPPAPGVTITPAPGEVPVPADLAAPAVPPPGVPPVVPAGDERFAPPLVVPPAPEVPSPVEPGPRTPEGDAVTQQVGAENLVVKGVADAQAQKLEASNAPETAKAIQQVAARSNAGATVSAAEFLAQAKAQVADETVAAAEAAARAAPAAEAAPGAVQSGEFAQPGYTAAAPAPAPEAATPIQPSAQAAPAAPVTETAPPAAVVVGGQVFTGATHEEAVRAAHAAVGTDAMASASGGWVDETGRFVSHEIYEAHRDLNTAIEQAGGNMKAPAVAEAQAQLAEAQVRDEELNNQIVQPGGEQVVNTGIRGQEALVAVRPSQELAVPLAGVNVTVEGVTPEGQRTQAERPAAQALNDARNDRTAFQILLDCLT